MHREDHRNLVDGYCIQILAINDSLKDDVSNKLFYLRNVSKGGFCFIADIDLQIDDRIKVLLSFPDAHSQEVTGRICYCNEADGDGSYAYGFSIMNGFYSLKSTMKNVMAQ